VGINTHWAFRNWLIGVRLIEVEEFVSHVGIVLRYLKVLQTLDEGGNESRLWVPLCWPPSEFSLSSTTADRVDGGIRRVGSGLYRDATSIFSDDLVHSP
jgi:hypothetical protein